MSTPEYIRKTLAELTRNDEVNKHTLCACRVAGRWLDSMNWKHVPQEACDLVPSLPGHEHAVVGESLRERAGNLINATGTSAPQAVSFLRALLGQHGVAPEDCELFMLKGEFNYDEARRVRELVTRDDEAPGGQRQCWIMAPGEGAAHWPECIEKGLIMVGYDNMRRDLSDLKTREAMDEEFEKREGRPRGSDSRGIHEFVNVMRPGDILIAKKGLRIVLGYGIVSAPYFYDAEGPTYRHRRRVDWKKIGTWTIPDGMKMLPQKTLTGKSYAEVEPLLKLMGVLVKPPPTRPDLPAKNTIFYGPPGTGKTYCLKNKYFEMFTDRGSAETADDRADAVVRGLTWWEVIALALLDQADGPRAAVTVIMKHPLVQAKARFSSNQDLRAGIWSALQLHARVECAYVKNPVRGEPLVFDKDENSVWSVDRGQIERDLPELLRMLEDFKKDTPARDRSPTLRYVFTTFHQSFSYEDFIEGIKPGMDGDDAGQLRYGIKPGVFRTIADEAHANPSKDYALFIDEINRGNVASIFGELIALIEEDKRAGAANELRAHLPYSRAEFVVPPNLYIIGTMNTADRSVEALDTALRRRFTFVEMRPDSRLIVQPERLGVDLAPLMDTINARIEQLLDHDHAIGHAYFMGIKNLPDLQAAFKNRVIPLLREYFYGNPAKVGMVLGDRFVKRKAVTAGFAGGQWGEDDLDAREVYEFVDAATLTADDFASVYA